MSSFLGTRTSSRQPNGTPATRTLSRDFQRGDPGSTNQLSASLTFTIPTDVTVAPVPKGQGGVTGFVRKIAA